MFKFFEILEEVESPINGKLQVVRTFEGIRILGAGISQSGWLVRKIWDEALKKLKEEKPDVGSVVILGLGGGSIAELVSYYWPQADIVGVDKDPIMLSLGKKYLHLGEIPNLEVVEGDAVEFIDKRKEKPDVILVDVYVGQEIPDRFKTEEFLQKLKDTAKKGGVVGVNHLYSSKEKESAHELGRRLRKIFPVVREVYPEANVIFICYKE